MREFLSLSLSLLSLTLTHSRRARTPRPRAGCCGRWTAGPRATSTGGRSRPSPPASWPGPCTWALCSRPTLSTWRALAAASRRRAGWGWHEHPALSRSRCDRKISSPVSDYRANNIWSGSRSGSSKVANLETLHPTIMFSRSNSSFACSRKFIDAPPPYADDTFLRAYKS